MCDEVTSSLDVSVQREIVTLLQELQSEEQLGQSLSGGCVRQAQTDAIWMWDWAQLGTKVVVLP